jgi:hypothetical protein
VLLARRSRETNKKSVKQNKKETRKKESQKTTEKPDVGLGDEHKGGEKAGMVFGVQGRRSYLLHSSPVPLYLGHQVILPLSVCMCMCVSCFVLRIVRNTLLAKWTVTEY